MVASSAVLAVVAPLFISQALAAAAPSLPIGGEIARRGGGFPDSNPPGVSCYNTWERVTNDPVVQYWYVVVKDAGNQIKADRVWNHLNLNGCAPTEHKYHAQSQINGAALTFHTSEACTADRVSKAIREGSQPGINVACEFTPKEGPDPGEAAASAGDAILEGILEGLSHG